MAAKSLAIFALTTMAMAVDTPSCLSQEKEPSPESARRHKTLIDQLASPNSKPQTHVNGKPYKVRFPADYDVEAQERVDEARQSLNRDVAEALPYLVEALEDKRYSMTINWGEGDGYYNKTVGDICSEVIASNLEVYRSEITFLGPQHWHQYTYPNVNRDWLSKQGNRTLAELQLEAIDWAIDQRVKENGRYAREDRTNEAQKLREMREKLNDSKTPFPGSRLLPMQTKNR
jgi:hypothetical protein